MNNYQGIIFAYKSYPELRELVAERTAASLPICSRYRLIDFSLSSLRNAGIVDVGVIMQRDYQSLLDHLGSGKPWDMSRRTGGLRMLPPFGLPAHHRGDYSGTIEALNAVSSYIEEIPKKYIVLMIGNLCANINLREVCRVTRHLMPKSQRSAQTMSRTSSTTAMLSEKTVMSCRFSLTAPVLLRAACRRWNAILSIKTRFCA